MPTRIFVSYSHKDKDWHSRLKEKLGSGQYARTFELWTDDKIEPGVGWEDQINRVLAGSRIALLLVSQNFLLSDFITNHELRELLKRYKAGGTRIFWIAVDPIQENLLGIAGLDLIQAIWPIDRPLSRLKSNQLEDAWALIGAQLIDAVNKEQWDDLKQKVAEALAGVNVILGKVIAEGDYSVFYEAKQGEIDVAVKAMVPAPGRAQLATDFIARAKLVRDIANSTAIEIRHVVSDPLVPCVVMDFVKADTLAKRLKDGRELEPHQVADVLAQLARVAGHLHDMTDQLVGPVRPSHVHYSEDRKKAFISLLPIANETLASSRENPISLVNSESLSCLSPERYEGKPMDWRTDQYHLGLLATDLLNDSNSIKVESFADLAKVVDYYGAPRKHFSEKFRRDQPAFSFVLARMLEREPDKRWKRMDDLVRALNELASGLVPEAVKQYVDEHYRAVLCMDKGRKAERFYRRFYDELRKSPDIDAILKRIPDMRQQYRKLDSAMVNVLNFTYGRRTSTLGVHAANHRALGVDPAHFGKFQSAFVAALTSTGLGDDYAVDAWRAVLDPVVRYMAEHVAGEQGGTRTRKPRSAARNVAPARGASIVRLVDRR